MTSTKMLQIIIDGQAGLRREMKEGHGSLRNEMREGFKKVNKRLDMIGRTVAFLEEDAPTREEHELLEKRVSKVEKKLQIQAS